VGVHSEGVGEAEEAEEEAVISGVLDWVAWVASTLRGAS
jgi:hypothetical protein